MNDHHNLDRLYELLPQHIRVRDVEQGCPLRALLRVITRQVEAVDADMAQLYANWFIETCEDWVAPYIGELIGYEPVEIIGDPGISRSPARDRVLIPRREVANTIRYRTRKGTLAVLEELATDVTGWMAAAVEFFDQTPIAEPEQLEPQNAEEVKMAVGADFFKACREQLVRGKTMVGLFAWRKRCYPVTMANPNFVEILQGEFYTFSPLANNTPLFTRPEHGPGPADRRRLPLPISRAQFAAGKQAYYGEGKSLCIYSAEPWPPKPRRGSRGEPKPPYTWHAIQPEFIVPVKVEQGLGSLRELDRPWFPEVGDYQIVVDPELGRFVFPGRPRQRPRRELRVSYYTGFHADLGGGEYQRPLSGNPEAQVLRTPCAGLKQALDQADGWLRKARENEPGGANHVLVEITDSELFLGWLPAIVLGRGQTLQIRAANRTRPVVWIVEKSTSLPDSLQVLAYPASCFILDGVVLAGRGLHVDEPEDQVFVLEMQPARVIVRHSTLVPGWLLLPETEPVKSEGASIELNNVMTTLLIQRSIVGSISVAQEDVPGVDPSQILIEDSILDSTDEKEPALYGEATKPAYVALTVRRSTVLGEVDVRELPLAENSIFRDRLEVQNLQGGLIRYSAFHKDSRVPQYFKCVKIEPPLPEFVDQHGERYGTPEYCRLANTADNATLLTGAEFGGEMGVYFHLFDPLRLKMLDQRLDEFLPLGVEGQVFLVE